eukprot:15340995-Ditylum_brightwellii.AAC.1
MSVAGHNPKKETNDWCWNEDLWTCIERGKVSFDDWIKNVVVSMIHCCYTEIKSQNDGEISRASYVRGEGEFFPRCIGMCARVPEFASTIFPGIIYDLLATDNSSATPNQSSVRDSILEETAVGSANNIANQTLSRCFSCLLGTPSPERTDSFTNPKALSLAIDTLDLLRRVTQHRFLKSTGHARNKSTLPNRTYPDRQNSGGRNSPKSVKDTSQYNSVESAPPWRGVPYGVVMFLNGVDLSFACLHAKRFASSLYFSDMFVDNWLGGAGGAFERLSSDGTDHANNERPSYHCDISGFGIDTDADNELNSAHPQITTSDDLKSAIAIQQVIKQSLLHLHDYDSLRALEDQSAAMCFKQKDPNRSDFDPLDRVTSDTIERLRNIDGKLLLSSESFNLSDSLKAADCLQELGLCHVSRHYLAAFDSDHLLSNSSEKSRNELKEKWSQDCWRMMNWDDSLLGNHTSTQTQSSSQ